MHPLYELLETLEKAHIHFEIRRYTSSSVTVVATPMPGLRLEIDVFEDGQIEFCKFKGDETPIVDQKQLQKIIDDVVALDAKHETPSSHDG